MVELSGNSESLAQKENQDRRSREQVPSYQEWKQAKATAAPGQISVLTFNIALDGKFGVPGVIDLIRRSGADVVGLQESEKHTAEIAQALGFHYVQHGYAALLTRFDIEQVSPGSNGLILKTDEGQKFAFFNKHLYYKPYQPYQLLHIPYEDAPFISTEAEAVAEATKARGADVEDVRKDIAGLPDRNLPTILVGDFNEPSHLDWTEAAARAGQHPLKVEWPASKAFAEDGFKDSYRQLRPDEVKHPGFTWTPTTEAGDPNDHRDRLDYILYRGAGIKLRSVDVIGENAENADIVVSPYPSDHRAVKAVFELEHF
jgi:exodeoxyribonuclease III